MIDRLASLRGRLGSHWLASAFAAAYLFISVALGIALLTTPKDAARGPTPAASTPTYVYEQGTAGLPGGIPNTSDDFTELNGPTSTRKKPPPPTTTTRDPLAGYQRVSGPFGLKTVIPNGWPTGRTSGPGALQASDPANSRRYVKYGGSAQPSGLTIENSHIQYENDFAVRTPGYRRIVLSSASYGGHDAVEWEFEQLDRGQTVHVRSLYWRAGGKEYFVLAAAPVKLWTGMRPVYDTMVANTSP